jgi:hypothetical protein
MLPTRSTALVLDEVSFLLGHDPGIAYFVAWSTGAALLLSLAALPCPVCPALGASPPPEPERPSIAGIC